MQKLNADKAKRAKPEPLEKSVDGDFLQKLNADRSKKQAHKDREQTVNHDQGGPEL
ncbi:hypothetical protein [Lactiplantibacillus plantarum]|uniref:hypothetical protein n=1 Tax=Lactiplantibacillus plantarum TaxID=1590 RepID=UPI003F52B547